MTWASASKSVQGKSHSRNCDNFLSATESFGNLFAVADGVGDSSSSAASSQAAITAFHNAGLAFEENKYLNFANLEKLNAVLYEKSQVETQPSLTTLTGVLIENTSQKIRGIHCGDSSAFCLASSSAEIQKLTRDHTFVNQMVQDKIISAESAATHPRRSTLNRCIGLHPKCRFDEFEIEMAPDSLLLICSDGITGRLNQKDIAQILSTNLTSLEKGASQLIDAAISKGSKDDCTVVIARPSLP